MVPIFIGGCERSGTTLLGSLFGSDEFIVLPECRFKNQLIETDLSLHSIKYLKNKIVSHHKFSHLGIDKSIIWNYPEKNFDKTAFSIFIIKEYALKQDKDLRKIKYWVDHCPDNLAKYLKLSELYPNAFYIHLIRDGRAIFNSVKKLEWGPNNPIDAGRWWLQKLSYGFIAEMELRDRAKRIFFEDLVENYNLIYQDIQKFLDNNGDGSAVICNYFIDGYTKKQHLLVGNNPKSKSIDKWKQELSEIEIHYFERITLDMLLSLGYKFKFEVTQNKKVPVFYRIKWILVDIVKKGAWKKIKGTFRRNFDRSS